MSLFFRRIIPATGHTCTSKTTFMQHGCISSNSTSQFKIPITSILRCVSTTSSVSSSSSSTSSSTDNISTYKNDANSGHKRICLTLYRQLLRWCNETDSNIPLKQFIPPIHMEPPQIHPDSLKKLASNSKDDSTTSSTTNYFPPVSIIKEKEMTIPIYNSNDVKQFIRGIFRMNAYPPTTLQTQNNDKNSHTHNMNTMIKEQVSLAFEAVRNLNELKVQNIKMLIESRNKHYDRTNVLYRIGQVVQHETQNWRGVVLGWNHHNTKKTEEKQSTAQNDSATIATSLTQKSYQSTNPEDDVQYVVSFGLG